ncbi:BON domain-containing protein [Sphaerotilus sp.]|uniref:BON domain-containing protein n=1 Tax=Sphaerotilus sp. TaxID=2093942 RepID=UPI0034E223A1
MTPRFNQILLAAALLTGFAAAHAGTATGATPDDVALATRVQSALQQSRPFQRASTDITVSAAGGQVNLSGFIPYANDDLPARTIAATVPGVQSVTSSFRAWSTESDPSIGLPATSADTPARPATTAMNPEDAALAAQVKAALLQAAPFQDADVDLVVTADNGQVRLSGWVSHENDELPARTIAAKVAGVRSVTSHFHAWSTELDARV